MPCIEVDPKVPHKNCDSIPRPGRQISQYQGGKGAKRSLIASESHRDRVAQLGRQTDLELGTGWTTLSARGVKYRDTG